MMIQEKRAMAIHGAILLDALSEFYTTWGDPFTATRLREYTMLPIVKHEIVEIQVLPDNQLPMPVATFDDGEQLVLLHYGQNYLSNLSPRVANANATYVTTLLQELLEIPRQPARQQSLAE